jgi:hypothetical protein
MTVRNQVRELFVSPPRRLGSEDPTARFPREDETPPPEDPSETPSSRAPTAREP